MGAPKRSKRADLYEKPTYLDLLARLAANVRRLREERGWTQAVAAERCDMAVYVLQTVEAGRSNFTGTVISRLCDGLGVDVKVLFEPAAPLAKRPRGRPGRSAPQPEVAPPGPPGSDTPQRSPPDGVEKGPDAAPPSATGAMLEGRAYEE
jgi:transcriptional regulator with XRE-family HTH domain